MQLQKLQHGKLSAFGILYIFLGKNHKEIKIMWRNLDIWIKS